MLIHNKTGLCYINYQLNLSIIGPEFPPHGNRFISAFFLCNKNILICLNIMKLDELHNCALKIDCGYHFDLQLNCAYILKAYINCDIF